MTWLKVESWWAGEVDKRVRLRLEVDSIVGVNVLDEIADDVECEYEARNEGADSAGDSCE